jgi:hypothetical protein
MLGAAETAIPGVWDRQRPLRRPLDQDIAASPELHAARSQYRQCAQATGGILASKPGDARRVAVADAAKAGAVLDVLAECEAGWAADYDHSATATAARFVDSHGDELSAIRHHYETALKDLRQDADFLTYLGEQALAQG